MKKPCLTCTSVQDPSQCESKMCGRWRLWFLCEWERLRSVFGVDVQKDAKR